MRYLHDRRGRLVVSAVAVALSIGVAALAAWDLPLYLGLPLLAALGTHYVWRGRRGHPLHRFALLSTAALAVVACLLFGLFFLGETMKMFGRGDPYAMLTLYLAFVVGLGPAIAAGLVFCCVLQIALAEERQE